MVDKDLVNGVVGSEGKYDICFKGGKLCAEVDYVGKQLEGGVVLKLDAGAVLDALAKAIPGTFDDTIINLAKGLLLGA